METFDAQMHSHIKGKSVVLLGREMPITSLKISSEEKNTYSSLCTRLHELKSGYQVIQDRDRKDDVWQAHYTKVDEVMSEFASFLLPYLNRHNLDPKSFRAGIYGAGKLAKICTQTEQFKDFELNIDFIIEDVPLATARLSRKEDYNRHYLDFVMVDLFERRAKQHVQSGSQPLMRFCKGNWLDFAPLDAVHEIVRQFNYLIDYVGEEKIEELRRLRHYAGHPPFGDDSSYTLEPIPKNSTYDNSLIKSVVNQAYDSKLEMALEGSKWYESDC